MQNSKKLIVSVIAILAVILIMLGVYSKFGPSSQVAEGTKAYTLEVVDDKQASKTYEGKTDAEYLRDLLDEVAAKGDFSYEGDDGQYGLYITTVNGITADYSLDSSYWAIYVNGEYGQYSADQQPVADGDAFRLVYEK